MTSRSISRFDDVILTGGTGRSGTTIVGRLIAKHSQIVLAKPTEVKFLTASNGLLDLHLARKMGRYRRFIINDWVHLQEFRRRLYHQWWSRDRLASYSKPDQIPDQKVGLILGMQRSELDEIFLIMRKEFKFDKSEAARKFLRGVIQIHVNEGKEMIWVDTTPINIARAGDIHDFLPGVRFINMVRDGRDAISSVIRESFGPNTYEEGLKWWRIRMIKSLQSSKKVGSKMLTLALEDLVINKRDHSFQQILDFSGVKDEELMHTYFENEVLPAKVRQGRWKNEVNNISDFNKKYLDIVAELREIDPQVPIYI